MDYPAAGAKKAGAGVVDSGIWPESAAKGGTGIKVSATFNGVCQGGEAIPAGKCNDKLVGARYHVAGFGVANVADEDFISPRDGAGCGRLRHLRQRRRDQSGRDRRCRRHQTLHRRQL